MMLAASAEDLSHRYRRRIALENVTLDLRQGSFVALIGPDGVGKSTLLAILAGAKQIQTGKVHVLGGDMSDARHRRAICARVAYMPQGLGRNLYPDLSVRENITFFARLFGQGDSCARAPHPRFAGKHGTRPIRGPCSEAALWRDAAEAGALLRFGA